ncbi:MAG: F-type H+-transporting ATPase subunit c [Elusimicrobia bacterium]|nr:MAG: F-type H+-transporting ATPase subunit c [Elusimicrobiota bacterium]
MAMWHLAFGYIGVGLGAGLVLLAAGFGIAKLASAALEGAARQPEAAGQLQTMMIIPAAMIEGAALFALVIFFLAAGALNKGVPAAGGSEAPAASAH